MLIGSGAATFSLYLDQIIEDANYEIKKTWPIKPSLFLKWVKPKSKMICEENE